MTETRALTETGSVEIPQTILDAFGWKAGTELEVVERHDEVVLRRKPETLQPADIPQITLEEFLARRIRYQGPPITQEMMDAAVLEEATRRWHAKGG